MLALLVASKALYKFPLLTTRIRCLQKIGVATPLQKMLQRYVPQRHFGRCDKTVERRDVVVLSPSCVVPKLCDVGAVQIHTTASNQMAVVVVTAVMKLTKKRGVTLAAATK